MAHELIRGQVRLHQALHGYDDGHRLLSSSIALKPRDVKTMLIMSDASGPGAVISEAGYLTGYPLPDSGVYALARTWAATEVSRPGCVWTHTLLLGFEDLAMLTRMDDLNNFFRRPEYPIAGASIYDKPIDAEVRTGMTSAKILDSALITRLLVGLYGHPKERIISSDDEYAVELVMLLWAQQWPRLRRSFRFCTLAFGDRSSETSSFDLQFLPSEKPSIRSRFPNAVNADRLSDENASWIGTAFQDLVSEGSGLRIFLRQVGVDVRGGREAFVPLCCLYKLVPGIAHLGDSIEEAFGLVRTVFDTESANVVRKLLVSALDTPTPIAPDVADSVLRNLDLLKGEDLRRLAPRLGHALWARNPQTLLRLLGEEEPKRLIAKETLNAMSENELLDGLRHHPDAIPTLLEWRPDFLTIEDLWTITGSWEHQAIEVASLNSTLIDGTLIAIIKANRTELAPKAVHIFGSVRVLTAVVGASSTLDHGWSAEFLGTWLTASLNDAQAVAEVLSSGVVPYASVLLAMARQTYPDFVPNDIGEDPWWTAIAHAESNLAERDWHYLLAYLMARALGHRSRNSAELIRFTLDEIYFPVYQYRLAEEAWGLIDGRLPRSWSFLFDWDSCQRLLDAVADVFVSRNLSSLIFIEVTKDDQVFRRLGETTARTGRGRRFLEQTIQAASNKDQLSERRDLLQELI